MGTRTLPPEVGSPPVHAPVRPVVLATMGVPFDERASVYAVDTAVRSGARLMVVNCSPLEPLRMSIVFGYDALEEFTPEVSASVRRPAELAASIGVRVERVRVRSPRPVRALLQFVVEVRPGLLVFGPDRTRLRARSYRSAERAIKEHAECVLWMSPDST